MSHYYYKSTCKVVRPMMSSDFCEARRRVLGLYRAIYRFIPQLVKQYDIPKNEEDCRWMLRSYFYKNACVTDVRVMDVLVIKGYMELEEMTNNWMQKSAVFRHWNPSQDPKPCTFLQKFVAGID